MYVCSWWQAMRRREAKSPFPGGKVLVSFSFCVYCPHIQAHGALEASAAGLPVETAGSQGFSSLSLYLRQSGAWPREACDRMHLSQGPGHKRREAALQSTASV